MIHQYPPDVRAKALHLLREGVRQAEVARRLGVALATVHRWRTAEGLPGAYAARPKPDPMRLETVLQRIEAARVGRKWTWDRLASVSCVSERAIHALRNGATTRPQESTLMALGEALGLTREEVSL